MTSTLKLQAVGSLHKNLDIHLLFKNWKCAPPRRGAVFLDCRSQPLVPPRAQVGTPSFPDEQKGFLTSSSLWGQGFVSQTCRIYNVYPWEPQKNLERNREAPLWQSPAPARALPFSPPVETRVPLLRTESLTKATVWCGRH